LVDVGAAVVSSGYSQGLVDVGVAASSGYSQGLVDVVAAVVSSGYSQGLVDVGAAASSGYSQGLVDVGAAVVSSGTLPVISGMQNNDLDGGDGGYLGVQASVVETAFDGLREVGGAGATVYHLSSGSKGSPTRPADAVYHLANRETKTSWMDEHLEVTTPTQDGDVQASTVTSAGADGIDADTNSADDADGAKSAGGSPDVTAPRSITRRVQSAGYLEVEGEDDDEGTRL
jgi:hypothetical protein